MDIKKIKAKTAARKARRKENAKFIAKVSGNGIKIPRSILIERVKAKLWDKRIVETMARDNKTCQYCGNQDWTSRVPNIHHWYVRQSQSKALVHDIDNLSTVCSFPCHIKKIHGNQGAGREMMGFLMTMAIKVGPDNLRRMDELSMSKNAKTITLEDYQNLLLTENPNVL